MASLQMGAANTVCRLDVTQDFQQRMRACRMRMSHNCVAASGLCWALPCTRLRCRRRDPRASTVVEDSFSSLSSMLPAGCFAAVTTWTLTTLRKALGASHPATTTTFRRDPSPPETTPLTLIKNAHCDNDDDAQEREATTTILDNDDEQ